MHAQSTDNFLMKVDFTITRDMFNPETNKFCTFLDSEWLKEHGQWSHAGIELLSSRTQIQHHLSSQFYFARIYEQLINVMAESKTKKGVELYDVKSALHSSGKYTTYRDGKLVFALDYVTTVNRCWKMKDREEAKNFVGTKVQFIFRPSGAIKTNDGTLVLTVPRLAFTTIYEENGLQRGLVNNDMKYPPQTHLVYEKVENPEFSRLLRYRLATDKAHNDL